MGDLDHVLKKINKIEHGRLSKCGSVFDYKDSKLCGNDACYVDVNTFYAKNVEDGRLISGGALQGLSSDVAGGVIGLVLSLALLAGGLVGLCKTLQKVFLGKAR